MHARHKLLFGWILALASCGGSSQPSPPDGGTGTGIGPEGGTVTEPYGAQIIVPAGALATTIDLGIARDLSDAPSLAAIDIDTAGAGYALTPHGTTFATPATIQIPFDADRLPSDATPVLYKAEPGGGFAPIATTVSGNMLVATVGDFSWVIPGYAATSPRMVYALVNTNSTLEVASFRIDKATGALGTPTSTAAVGTGASSVIVHPNRRFAFVVNGSSGVPGGATNVAVNSISVYALDPVTGAISGPLDTQPANANPITAVVHPSGKFVYIVNEQRFGTTTGNISVYSIDPVTGHLTPRGTSADLLGPPATAIAFTPSGRFAFVTYIPAPSGSTTFFDTVDAFSVDPSTGLLTGPVSSAGTGDNPWAVAVTPKGNAAYVASLGVQGSVNDLTRYTIDPTSGSLTRRDSICLGGEPASLAIDPEGRFLYAARQQVDNNQNLFVFAIDSASGALTPTSSTLTSNGSGPIAVVAEPQAHFVYATGNGAIVPYALDATGGTLVPGTPTGPIAFQGGSAVGDPFAFAASGASPVWVNGCTWLGDDVFVTGQCPLPSGIGTTTTTTEADMARSQSATHQLDVSTGVWGGVITSSPAGIDYNSDGDPQAFVSGSFATGSTVELCGAPPASATQVYDFKWTGSGGCSGTAKCTTVVMSADEGCHLELTVRPPS